MNNQIPNARPGAKFLTMDMDRRPRQNLMTSCKLLTRCFQRSRHFLGSKRGRNEFSVIEDKSRRRRIGKTLLLQLQSEMSGRGRTFLSSGEQLHHRASPLIFYYSFLNLAKAYLRWAKPEMSLDPTTTTFRYHGLVASTPHNEFSKEIVEVNRGVFTAFYETLTGKSLPLPAGAGVNKQPGFSLKIAEMMNYASDVCFDYANATGDKSRHSSGRSKMVIAGDNRTAWMLLAIGFFEGPVKIPGCFCGVF